MAFKSPTQPYCRCCGKPIAKRTHTRYVKPANAERPGGSDPASWLFADIRSKADAQKHTNEIVVSINYHDGETVSDFIKGLAWKFTTWDRESYVDEHFCSNMCTYRFARLAAQYYPTLETVRASTARQERERKAREKQKEKAA